MITLNFEAGTLFHNRYEIQTPLGRGGMGIVYKARDRTLDEVVAIKVLRPDFAQDPKMAERFKSEIKLARKVRHRNVCTIHEFGEDSGLLFISMEYLEGTDMKHLLRERGAFPLDQAYDLTRQVADGLQAVHDAGIIHRDLKSPNIMLEPHGVARLMDFGIAKRQGDATLTATGQVVGTPEYMSPEQAQGHKVDFRSDIYSLGVVTYEIFTGKVPFQGETPISTILKHINDPPPLDGKPAEKLPPALKSILRRALAKAPSDRFATASQFADAVQRSRSPSPWQEPGPTAVLDAPTLTRSRTVLRGGRPWVAGALVVVAVGVLLVLVPRRDAPRRTEAQQPLPPVPSPAVSTPVPASPSPLEAQATPTPAPPVPRPPRPSVALPQLVRATVQPAPVPSAATVPPKEALASSPTPAPEVRSGTGLLQVGVKPWAEVTIDGRIVGTTPLDRLSLTAGVHTIQLRHPSYEPLERKVSIQPGETERLIVDLSQVGVRKR